MALRTAFNLFCVAFSDVFDSFGMRLNEGFQFFNVQSAVAIPIGEGLDATIGQADSILATSSLSDDRVRLVCQSFANKSPVPQPSKRSPDSHMHWVRLFWYTSVAISKRQVEELGQSQHGTSTPSTRSGA